MLLMCPIYSRTGASSCSDKDTGVEKHSGPTPKAGSGAAVHDTAPLEFFTSVSYVKLEIPFNDFVL